MCHGQLVGRPFERESVDVAKNNDVVRRGALHDIIHPRAVGDAVCSLLLQCNAQRGKDIALLL